MLLEMGSLTSRQNIGVEEVDIPSSSVYRYPPKSGKQSNNRSGCRRGGAREPLSVAPGASPGHRVGSLEAAFNAPHHLFIRRHRIKITFTHTLGEKISNLLQIYSVLIAFTYLENCIGVIWRF